MKIAAIIPSRYHSTRFEGKPLALIARVSMIQRVYEQVEKSGRFSQVIVATDDQRISDAVEGFGGTVAMTSPHHTSGSERIWEVMEKSDFDATVNIQGDEPIVPVKLIQNLYQQLNSGQYDVVTPFYRNTSYDDYQSPNVVKAVMDSQSMALYFSRSPVPYVNREDFSEFYQHIGMYGYLKSALKQFIQLPPSRLEKSEKLEQLRFLDNGIRIKLIESKYPSIGVDVPGDVARVEAILNRN